MRVFFEVIDRTTGNLIKDYETKAAALSELEAVARAHGFDEIRDYALLMFEDGIPSEAAIEDELVALVKAVDPRYWEVESALVAPP